MLRTGDCAFYLGHHYSYRREIGEPQPVFNFCKTFSDFHTNFALTGGVNFQSPKATEAIVPQMLNTIWDEHQPQGKQAVLWEIMQQGSVSGDAFVKVAFEPAWEDPNGFKHSPRIRILPLNSAFCFPEYHPHDMTRMIRFKMKYRFWGTALEGTRQVFSYTELWTEQGMQAFINDELVEDQENPLGRIPFVHIANTKVPSSPWGLSDIQDITDLNRIYNETMMLLLDIVNYYSSPTTVIMGAKANNLERGPRKVWAVPNDKARIENLTLGAELGESMKFAELIKEKMHEIVGVPIDLLGQEQEISNTSGVALRLKYLPLVQKFNQKATQYSSGFAMLNELLILVAAIYLPEMLEIDPERDPPLEEGQLTVLDPVDPLAYRNTVEFASPLPLDMLILLNEIMMKMQMGMESKEGALRLMGEPNPAEKLQELMDELHNDALEQGALDLLNSQIKVLISMLTGLPPEGAEPAQSAPQGQAGAVPSAGGPGVSTAPQIAPQPDFAQSSDMQELMGQLSNMAEGTKIPQVRNPLKGGDDD